MIAVPITAATAEQAIADIKTANRKADAIELRLDFLEEVTEIILQELMQQCRKLTIVNFANKNFGAALEQTERMFLLQRAIGFGADFIDIDFDVDKRYLPQFVKVKGNVKIILSKHDFDETPALPKLLRLLDTMMALPCAVVKIVTYAKSEADNDSILALIHAAKSKGKQIIAFCTGPKGKRSRIQCIKMGALLTFASLAKGKESAEGQLTVDEMRRELEKSI